MIGNEKNLPADIELTDSDLDAVNGGMFLTYYAGRMWVWARQNFEREPVVPRGATVAGVRG